MTTIYENLLMRVALPAEAVFADLFTVHPTEYSCALFYVSVSPAEPIGNLPAWVDESCHEFAFEFKAEGSRPLVRQLMLSLIASTNFQLAGRVSSQLFHGSFAITDSRDRTILNAEQGGNTIFISTAFDQQDILETFARDFTGMHIVRYQDDRVVQSRPS